MLEEIRISGLGVIDEAVLELGPGLTVLTGETGAGKTMVVAGLALLFGGRADPARIRPGRDRAVVAGRVRVDPDGPVARRAAEAGAEPDGDELLVVRTVTAEGRSRAHVGGVAVPVGVLAELGGLLVAVHGQADQQRLLRPARQRAALDAFGGPDLVAALSAYRTGYRALRAATGELDRLAAGAAEREREADLLRLGLEEVAAAAPEPGEEERLRRELDRLGAADALRAAAGCAHALLAGDDDGADATGLLSRAGRALAPAADTDADLRPLADRLAELGVQVADVAGELASYLAGVEADPARLAALQARRARLAPLLRRYGPDCAAVLAWAAEAGERLAVLADERERAEPLRAEVDRLLGELAGHAGRLSAARHAAATRFAAEVQAELTALALPGARLEVAVTDAEDPAGLPVGDRRLGFGPDGVDEVEIRLAAHPGAPSLPLGRGASGGELSRVMLAVEVVLAGADPLPVAVFDEVDAGVGGRAAGEVGRRLARLAGHTQVLVVTHLPQVAAYADRHLRVAKGGRGGITSSDVRALDDSGRVLELSRMLAGVESSALARGHAEELLGLATATKARV